MALDLRQLDWPLLDWPLLILQGNTSQTHTAWSLRQLVLQRAEVLVLKPSGQVFLGTRPNISESHSEISARVHFCIAQAAQLGVLLTTPREPVSANQSALSLFLVRQGKGGEGRLSRRSFRPSSSLKHGRHLGS